MDNMIGKILGNRYELVEKIGGGGMAVVYKAKCRLLNRFVAVKILRTDSEMTEDFIKRFKVEAQAAGSLSHPNIVSIYDVGNEGDINYIVMEYVEGYTLKEVIAQSGKLTWRATIKIASQICAGLEQAHKNHIIHRDIKSQNILVNQDLVAKVTDFGIARASSNSTITMTGNTIGSVHYFSPEQAKGQHTDEKSDIYSLGVVMYEMITGRLPFDADTPVSVALKQIQEIPKPPIQLEPDMPMSVNDIIMKSLQKEPRLRYQSATEMLKDLQSVLTNPDSTIVTEKNIGATTVMPSVTENMINERVNKPVKVEEEPMARRNGRSSTGKSVFAFIVSLVIVAVLSFLLFSKLWSVIFEEGSSSEVVMPNLVGRTYQEAEILLKEKNIKIRSVNYKDDDNYKKGYVCEQKPVANINVKADVEIVDLMISNGSSEIEIPDIVNWKKDDAIQKLEDNDLEANIIEDFSEEVPIGYVIKTNPISGRTVSAEAIIDVYVSSGSSIKKVNMPNLVGKTLDEAKKIVEQNNIKIKSTQFKSEEYRADNVVLAQSVDAGNSVEEGTEIILTVNKKATVVQNKKTIYLNLSNKGINDQQFLVEVKMSGGGITGKKTIYSKYHTRADGEISLDIYGVGEAMVEMYIDGSLDSSVAITL